MSELQSSSSASRSKKRGRVDEDFVVESHPPKARKVSKCSDHIEIWSAKMSPLDVLTNIK